MSAAEPNDIAGSDSNGVKHAIAPCPTGAERVRNVCINLLMVFAVLYLAGKMLSPHYQLSFSLTRSLPGTVWLIRVGAQPQRGDYVAFHIPPNRFYPNEHGGFLKIVRGVAGDSVTRDGQRFFINGDFVGIAKTVSLNGLPLAPGPVGVIPATDYFVWTPELDSFDSRYRDIGWVSVEQVVGTARPVF